MVHERSGDADALAFAAGNLGEASVESVFSPISQSNRTAAVVDTRTDEALRSTDQQTN